MFENYRVFSTTLAGRKLTVETGKIAQLANGSALVRYGDTAILATATASASPREGIDFLPLSVDFEERLYAVGKIPGSFMKREGKPSEKAILTSRVIDRPIRPLFPKDLRNDVTLNLLVLSVDPDCSPEVTGLIGASLALSISDIPWNGPVSSVFVGMVDGEVVINPTKEQRAKSTLELTVASSEKKVVMIEAGAKEISDDDMFDAIMKAHETNQEIVKFINHVTSEIGKKKFEYASCDVDHELYDTIAEYAIDKIKYALDTDDKNIREERLNAVYADVESFVTEKYPDEDRKAEMGECLYKLQKFVVRRWLLDEGKRVDGRKLDEIRPLASEVGILPRTHGSALFTRGQTQVLTIATLGLVGEQQLLDGIDDEEYKRYMHHYNMPSYSVGETKPSRGPGRREIGHGALAERALVPVIPSVEEFPYSIRLVSEVVSSNGSTSQGSICASTLALMDAGVPIKAPVAGISCGLITEGERWMTMVDIQGLEDFFGDMDFKVAGTKKGITAIQMDLKIDGLTPEIIKAAFAQTHTARDYILDEVMLKAIDKPRADVSDYAPKMITIKIDPEKIGDVIGKGGKVIQAITAETGAKIDIEDDGTVFIAAVDKNAGIKAKSIVEAIAFDPEPGAVFVGKVTRLMSFGAFVEIAPGKEGLVHISKLAKERVEKVEDVVSVGDEIKVKVLEIDDKGRINLSRKDAI
ncbi:MAG: polyribonucleotide nucleotidyltransferase [Ruminococcaceae bacterium]|nr:polyribonucleotide nucleotidyltransferase [Oscillospiraceae bacterium]